MICHFVIWMSWVYMGENVWNHLFPFSIRKTARWWWNILHQCSSWKWLFCITFKHNTISTINSIGLNANIQISQKHTKLAELLLSSRRGLCVPILTTSLFSWQKRTCVSQTMASVGGSKRNKTPKVHDICIVSRGYGQRRDEPEVEPVGCFQRAKIKLVSRGSLLRRKFSIHTKKNISHNMAKN